MGARLGILALTAAAALGAAAFMAALPGIVHADTRYVSFPVSYYRLVQSGVTTYSNQVVGYRFHWQVTRVTVYKTEYRWTRQLQQVSNPPTSWTQRYIRVGSHWEYRVTWGWQTVTRPVATAVWTLQNNVYQPQVLPGPWSASWQEQKPPSSGSVSTWINQLSWGENRARYRWNASGTMVNNYHTQWYVCDAPNNDVRIDPCSGNKAPQMAWTYGPPTGGLPPGPRDGVCWNWNVSYLTRSASGTYITLNDGTSHTWSSSFRYYEEMEPSCILHCLVDFYQTTTISYTTGWVYGVIGNGVPDYWTNYNSLVTQDRSASGNLAVSGWYVSGVPSFSLGNVNVTFQVWAPTGQWVLVDDYAWVEYPTNGENPFVDSLNPVTVAVEEPRFTLVAEPVYGWVQVPQMTWQLTTETVSVPVTIAVGAWPSRGVQGIPSAFWVDGQVRGSISTTVTAPSGVRFDVLLSPTGYSLSWGDGTPSYSGNSPGATYPPGPPSITHAYGSPGNYTVTAGATLAISYRHSSWSPQWVSAGSQTVSAAAVYPVDPPAIPPSSLSVGAWPSRGVAGVPAQFWADGQMRAQHTLTWSQNGFSLEAEVTPTSWQFAWGDGSPAASRSSPGSIYPPGPADNVHAYPVSANAATYSVSVTAVGSVRYRATGPWSSAWVQAPQRQVTASLSYPVDPPQPPSPGLGIGVAPDPGFTFVPSQFWATTGDGTPYQGSLPYAVAWTQNGYSLTARYSPVSSWRWTWGDGSPPYDSPVPGTPYPEPADVTHQYAAEGDYTVGLEVTMGWVYQATGPSGFATDWLNGPTTVPLSASRPYQVIQLTIPSSAYPSISLGINPRRGLTGLASWFWADGEARTGKTSTFSQGGITWEVWFQPTGYTWQFGDGAMLVTTSPGQPYPQASDVQHMYERSSLGQPGQAYTVRLDVTFTIWVRPEGTSVWYRYGDWTGGASAPHPVQQLQAVIGR